MKWISLLMLMVQNTATPLIFRSAMTSSKAAERFNIVHAVIMQELLKFLVSLVLLFLEEGGTYSRWSTTLRQTILARPRDTLKLSVPAILYFIQNMCLQLASSNLPAAVFQVMYQGKSLVVAFCSVVMLSKRLTRSKWLAIALMACGLVIVQLAKNTESKKAANDKEQSFALGLFQTLLGCFCSGFASVYFEKMMKMPTSVGNEQRKKPSMWVRNIQLAGFSMIIGILQLFSLSLLGTSGSPPPTFFHGFTSIVWLMVFNNALGGLCVALVIKHADNILKGFACAIATVLASIASVFFFGFHLGLWFASAMVTVIGSSLLYSGTISLGSSGDWWDSEPIICERFRGESQVHVKVQVKVPV